MPQLDAQRKTVVIYTALLSAGATAGTKKLSMLLSAPIASAATEISSRNGNIARVIDTASAVFSASKPGAMSDVSCGLSSIPSPTASEAATRITVRA